MGIVLIICIAVAILIAIICMTFVIYKQMILVNEINKRLLVLAETTVTEQANSISDLENKIDELEEITHNTTTPFAEQKTNFHDSDLDLS